MMSWLFFTRKKTALLGGLMVASLCAYGQTTHEHLLEGDRMYKEENYLGAEDSYRRAGDREKQAQAKYNLGNALYQQERFEEAAKQYEEALGMIGDADWKSKAAYNMGNALLQSGKLPESIDAYKESLRLNPADHDARNNMMLARSLLQQQQQQQQQQGEPSEDGEEQENQQPQPQEGEEPQEDQEQPIDQPEEGEQKEEESGEGQKPEQQRELSEEEARQLLKVADAEDAKVQEKMRKKGSGKKQPAKPW